VERELVTHTHDLTVDAGVLTKQYRSWARDEPAREWAALSLAHAHTADLVPRPLAARLDERPPSVSMTVVPGEPLRGPLTADQLDALETALRRLWAVPADGLPARRSTSDLARGRLTARGRPEGGRAARAYDASLSWLDRMPAHHPYQQTVLGHGDPNLANYLWDGERVRIVDFEDAGRSDVALELATLVEHLAARHTDWDGFLPRFDVDPDRLRAARALWAIFWLAMLLPGGASADRNPPGALDEQAERVLGLCGPTG